MAREYAVGNYPSPGQFAGGAEWMLRWVIAITEMGCAIRQQQLEKGFERLLGPNWADELEYPDINEPLVLSEETARAFYSDDDCD